MLVGALGYNGRQELRFKLHLGTQSTPQDVYESLAADDFVAMLQEWGYAAELQVRDDGVPVILGRTDHGPFALGLLDATEQGRAYRSVALRVFRKFKDSDEVPGIANAINRKFRLLQAHVDDDGDLVIESHGRSARSVRIPNTAGQKQSPCAGLTARESLYFNS